MNTLQTIQNSINEKAATQAAQEWRELLLLMRKWSADHWTQGQGILKRDAPGLDVQFYCKAEGFQDLETAFAIFGARWRETRTESLAQEAAEELLKKLEEKK